MKKFIKCLVFCLCVCFVVVFSAACSTGEYKLYVNAGNPTASVGVAGDYYINNETYELFVKKGDNTWEKVGNVDGLKGAKGDKGDDGAKGETGNGWLSGKGTPSNADGKVGDLYLDLNTGDVYVKNNSNAWVKESNLKGADGNDGNDGASTSGNNWLTGNGAPNNANGNDGDLYLDLDNYDFYMKASGAWSKEGNFKGANGANGADGATGPQGPQGPQGEKGNTGATGPQGPQGEKGATGPQGPQGEKGDTGAVGPQGPQGEKGDTGAVGPQGPQGEKGETGATGAPGKDGTAWLTGSDVPTAQTGKDGDFYINLTTGELYLKESGKWNNIGNIRGSTSGGTAQTMLTGDVNLDGKVNTADVDYLRPILAKMTSITVPNTSTKALAVAANDDTSGLSDQAKINADINCDGVVNINDLYILIHIANGHTGYNRTDYSILKGVTIGDTNKDGNISVVELTLMNRYIKANYELSFVEKYALDLDLDGKVGVRDLLLMRKHLASYIETLPREDDVAAQIPDKFIGDVNLDGNIDEADFNIIRDIVVNKSQDLQDAIILKLADVNNDDVVDEADLIEFNSGAYYVIGDVNFDGLIDMNDYRLIKAHMETAGGTLNAAVVETLSAIKAGDDGETPDYDTILSNLQRYIKGEITTLVTEE